MNRPDDVDSPSLPVWQAARLATLLDALGAVPISDAERRSLAWLCGFEAHTVEHLAAVIRRARSRSAALAARDQMMDAATAARADAAQEDRYRHQLIDLCEYAGVDPGTDPHAALLAHLRGPEGRGAER